MTTSGPLSGITVVDFTRNLAGPYCTMILGDLGARVIKVERPETGDDTRQWKPPSWEGYGAIFLTTNRNKESVALHIDDPADVSFLRTLVARADVVVESNRPGSMAKRGLGFDDVAKVNPTVVYCSLSGFGSRGPDADRPGYDAIVQAASGVMSINGEPDGNPVRVGASIIDQGAGMWAALGILGGLRQRERTGLPQHIETSLMETGVSWMGYQAANFFADSTVAKPQGTRHGQMAPYEGFQTGDHILFVAALNDNLFTRLCKSVGLPHLSEDPRFVTNSDRLTHRDELHTLLETQLQRRGAKEWERELHAVGVPCSQMRSIDDVLADPQVQALGLVRDWEHPSIEDFRLIDHPISYNGVRSFVQRPAPELGEHTEKIRAEMERVVATTALVAATEPNSLAGVMQGSPVGIGAHRT